MRPYDSPKWGPKQDTGSKNNSESATEWPKMK